MKNALQILHFHVRMTFVDHIRAFQKIWRPTEGYIQQYIDEIGGKFLVHFGYKMKLTSFLTIEA